MTTAGRLLAPGFGLALAYAAVLTVAGESEPKQRAVVVPNGPATSEEAARILTRAKTQSLALEVEVVIEDGAGVIRPVETENQP